MVSTRPPTSKSSRPFNTPLVTVPKAPITIGIIVTFMCHSFFQFPSKVVVLIFFSHSFSFILWTAETAKSTRTLNRIGQLSELTASAVEHKIDIICIQEHRYTHTEDIKYHETGNGWMLVTVSAWKNSVNASVGGVGILLGPRALKTLNSIERIQPRMMAATFNGNPKQQLSPATALPMLAKKTK